MVHAESWEEHRFEVRKECRYLLHVPEPGPKSNLLVIALHGYGQNPAEMMRLTQMVIGKDKLIASIGGPNEHFIEPNPATSAFINLAGKH